MSQRSLNFFFIATWAFCSTLPYRAGAETARNSRPDIHLIALAPALASTSRASSRSIVQSLPAGDFEETLTSVFSAIQGALVPKLAAQTPTPALQVELRTVGVGVGLTGSIGLGPIFQISLSPKLVLVFSNSKTPVYPD